MGFHHPRLNLRLRWTANDKKWVVIEFWRRADARRTFSAEFSAKTKCYSEQFCRNSSSVHKKLSTTFTAACQDGFSTKTLDFSFDHITTAANEQLFSVAGNNKISPNFVNTFFWLDFRTKSVVFSASAKTNLEFLWKILEMLFLSGTTVGGF